MSKSTISLCMIVKNEAKHLETCLQSVQGTVDEIIIVDTGSTDATVDIAKRFGAQVYDFEWIGDFAAARNFGLERATSDYMLVLDADEYFEADAGLLRQDIASNKDYYILRIKNYLNQASTYHTAIRLFKKNSGLKYRGRIHEHLDIENYPHYTNAMASPLLHHVGYLDAIYLEKNKHDRNLKLLEQAIQENPNGYNYFNLGRQYKAGGEHQKAFDAFKKSFAMSKQSVYITTLLNAMVGCLLNLKKIPEGIRLALDAIDSFPRYTDLYYSLGELYQAYGYLHDAERAFQKCLDLGEVEFLETVAGVGSFLAQAKISELHYQQGKKEDAVVGALQALQLDKNCNAALKIFLRGMQQAKVPLDEIDGQLRRAFPLTSGEDVFKLITALYHMRFPLLKRYIEAYNLKVEPVLLAIAAQYAGDYEEARQLWSTVESVQENQSNDLLLLAFLLQDAALFDRCKPLLNLSTKTAKLLRKIALREAVDTSSLPDDLGKLLLNVCVQTIQLQEFETFEYVSVFVMQGKADLQLELASVLQANVYTDTTVDLLLRLQQREPNQPEVYGLLGDICLHLNQLPDALQMYVRLFELNKDMSTFERLYRLYVQMGDDAGIANLKREMQERFPLSEWAKTL